MAAEHSKGWSNPWTAVVCRCTLKLLRLAPKNLCSSDPSLVSWEILEKQESWQRKQACLSWELQGRGLVKKDS